MSGTSDYTTTPNLGLYKPIFNRAVGTWGDLWNNNADALDAAVGSGLPTTGGTMTGPLNLTATGGTVARSEQARAADVANVLDYGADPTGVADSSGAFNAAAAQTTASGRRKSVYLPAGTYHVRHQINLSAGQTMFGDGRGNSIITVSDDFDPAATSVLYLTSGGSVMTVTPGGDAPGPVVRDLGITFVQPVGVTSRASFKTLAAGGTSGVGGTGVMYPPAIATGDYNRPQIVRVRICAAWDGISTNGAQAPMWLEDIEIGALDVGLSLGEGASGVYDWTHINGYHFWAFGMDAGNILNNVFNDGQTIAMRVGAQNGLEAKGICTYNGRVVFTAAAANCWANITDLNMDNDNATLEVTNVQWMNVANFYSTCGASGPRPAVSIAAGVVGFAGWYSHNSSQLHINVTGGDVTIIGGYMSADSAAHGVASVSGGTLRMSGIKLHPGVTGAWSQVLLQQGGTGVLQIGHLDVSGVAGSSGIAISFAADVLGNTLSNTIALASGWKATYPLGGNGYYGAVMVPPNDATSMQSGYTNFGQFTAGNRYSTAFGNLALGSMQTAGNQNTAFGGLAGYGVATGANNTIVGATAGYAASSTGFSNTTIVGAVAGFSLTTGTNNTFIGYNVGNGITTGSGNLYVAAGGGNSLGAPATESHTMRLGDNATANVLRATNIDTTAPHLFLDWLPASTTYANDAAAATGGVAVGQLYRNGSVVQIRVT